MLAQLADGIKAGGKKHILPSVASSVMQFPLQVTSMAEGCSRLAGTVNLFYYWRTRIPTPRLWWLYRYCTNNDELIR